MYRRNLMSAKQYKQIARSKLKGYWKKFALMFFLQFMIISAMTGSVIFSLISFLVTGPLQLGYVCCVLDFSRGKDFKIGNLFDGFDNFKSAFLLKLICDVLSLLWSFLLIVPGVIAGYSYSMSFYVLRDNPNIKPNEARNISIAMMQGHKWQLFCLHLSFIGWFLLSILTLGILLIWLMPYIELCNAEFYENLKK